MIWLLWLGGGLTLLVLLAIGLATFGERRWAHRVAALRSALESARGHSHPGSGSLLTRYEASELLGLPAPVQRYFRAVLEEGQPLITAVNIQMTGSFNLSPTAEQWKPFTSHQRVVMHRPGFLWDAQMAMLPGVIVRVVDSYILGKGLLVASVQGMVTMARQQGEGAIAHGEFMRWFAEALWYPTALLPSQGVRWDAVDANAAKATVVDGPLSLTLLFRFNEAGLIASFRAEARGGMVGGQLVMAPWEGSWSNYQTVDGVKVPFTGEVAWMRPEGRKPYFTGTVTAIDFERAA